jgi:hypothetical protein
MRRLMMKKQQQQEGMMRMRILRVMIGIGAPVETVTRPTDSSLALPHQLNRIAKHLIAAPARPPIDSSLAPPHRSIKTTLIHNL